MKQISDRVLKSAPVNWQRFQFIQDAEFKDISKEQFEKIKKSIVNNGFCESFKVWESGKKIYCLDGFHRCKALLELEQEGYTVPDLMQADFIDCKNRKEAAKLVLVYSSIYANVSDEGLYKFLHDFELNLDEIKSEIDLPRFDIELFEDGYLNDDSGGQEGEDDVPEDVEPTAKLGDLYLLGGKHRLFCGDCTVKENVEYLMNGEKADMVFTDPPYGLGGYGGRNNMSLEGDDKDVSIYYKAIPKAKECYIWGNYKNLMYHLDKEPRDVIVWVKNNFGLGSGYRGQYELCFYYGAFNGSDSDVWSVDKDTEYKHPTQKPVELCKRAIKNSNPQIVLDVFLGSGSTLIACEQTDRICYGMEIDPHYCDVIIQRYKDLTGKEVELIDRKE